MSKKSKNASTARDTLRILDQGFYINKKNQKVSVAAIQQKAVKDSVHYKPEMFADVFNKRDQIVRREEKQTAIEVINETTLYAAKVLKNEGFEKVLALNFASAKNPGGGFQNGAQAQEESLARASGLYLTQTAHWDMYEINRGLESCLYTDHMIYSPDVPVFRDDEDELLDAPYTVSFITAPAVNAGVVMQRSNKDDQEAIPSVMLARTEKVLSLAMVHGYRALVLGAWGCGVFRNNPTDVAEYFRYHLMDNPVFQNVFEKILFAVWDRSEKETTIESFRKVFLQPKI
ncbi:TIGR02452 family protein [Cytophagaceae bacterium DM2B3-1]|uniref:TIGR02452 family protein n=1 Tax=Xanthocytophaga flava TaxID=3048013 RepID=A0ABT7CLU7_9BACT|nr:TIGR02452 family protein [Xanthocytophaga flavus]MDJ1494665.1 TIGR02452 family protein [Xanthocytophaga flavus]